MRDINYQNIDTLYLHQNRFHPCFKTLAVCYIALGHCCLTIGIIITLVCKTLAYLALNCTNLCVRVLFDCCRSCINLGLFCSFAGDCVLHLCNEITCELKDYCQFCQKLPYQPYHQIASRQGYSQRPLPVLKNPRKQPIRSTAARIYHPLSEPAQVRELSIEPSPELRRSSRVKNIYQQQQQLRITANTKKDKKYKKRRKASRYSKQEIDYTETDNNISQQ